MLGAQVAPGHKQMLAGFRNQGAVGNLVVIVDEPEQVGRFTGVEFNGPGAATDAVGALAGMGHVVIGEPRNAADAAGLADAHFGRAVVDKAVLTAGNMLPEEAGVFLYLAAADDLRLSVVLRVAYVQRPTVPAGQ